MAVTGRYGIQVPPDRLVRSATFRDLPLPAPAVPELRGKPRLHRGVAPVGLLHLARQRHPAGRAGPTARASVAARGRMRRLIHAMIFLLIAGTNTGLPPGPDWAQMAGCRRLLGRWLDRGVGHAAAVRPARRRRWIADRYRRAGLLGRGGRVCLGRPDPVPAVFGYHKVARAGASAAADGVDAESSMSDTRIPARRPCRCSYGRVRLVADAMKKGATVI